MDAIILRLLLTAALALAASPALAQGVRTEPEVKAAYLYQFGGFVEWPPQVFAGPDSAFNIGILGNEAVAKALEEVTAGRAIQGRRVIVHRLRRGEMPPALNVLFIGRQESGRLPDILAGLEGRAVLTVTENGEGVERGAMINLFEAEGRVRFDVALAPAERARLKISARLLSVARRVVGRPT